MNFRKFVKNHEIRGKYKNPLEIPAIFWYNIICYGIE